MTGLHLAVDGVGLLSPRAGIGVYTAEILRAMAVDRPDCRLTVFVPGDDEPQQPTHPALAYRPLPDAPLVGRHMQWPAGLRRMRPDGFFGPAGALPLGDVGSPTVITVHDLAIYRNPSWFPGRQPLATRWVVPRSIARADRLIAVSTYTARDLEDLFDVEPGRLEVVHHGVSPRFRPMSSEDLAQARQRLKLPERFVLFVGTIEPRKNLATLFEAWAMLRNRPDLVIVGAWGWRYQEIRERMGRLGSGVHHLEALDPAELPAVYNLARLLAHPAWYEGFGLPPLEAMACGTPVVVSDRASLPEVVGDAGVVVAADDPGAWREALDRILGDADLSANLGRRGILRAAEFSWPRTAAQTWRVIDRAITERVRG